MDERGGFTRGVRSVGHGHVTGCLIDRAAGQSGSKIAPEVTGWWAEEQSGGLKTTRIAAAGAMSGVVGWVGWVGAGRRGGPVCVACGRRAAQRRLCPLIAQ